MLEEIMSDPTSVAIIASFAAVGAVCDGLFYIFLGATAFTFIKKKFFKKG